MECKAGRVSDGSSQSVAVLVSGSFVRIEGGSFAIQGGLHKKFTFVLFRVVRGLILPLNLKRSTN